MGIEIIFARGVGVRWQPLGVYFSKGWLRSVAVWQVVSALSTQVLQSERAPMYSVSYLNPRFWVKNNSPVDDMVAVALLELVRLKKELRKALPHRKM